MRPPIPDNFKDMVTSMPGVDADDLLRSLDLAPAVSIKLNKRKCREASLTGYEGLENVKWCTSGFYLPERPQFTLNPLMHAGAFYVQDASSMIYETIVEMIIRHGNLPENPAVIDLCAAPGGKTTSMLNALPDGTLMVANEIMPQRAAILKENLLKWGYSNTYITSSPTSQASLLSECFDIVAVDAPCSGEGMMRKDDTARTQWNPGLVEHCAELQRSILKDAAEALRPGGYLIYSTCTFNTLENESNLRYLIEEAGMEPVELPIPDEWGIGREITGNYPALRFMPHITKGEGLFAAVVKKTGNSIPRSHDKICRELTKRMKVISSGPVTTVQKGKTTIPSSEWALSDSFPQNEYPAVELDPETALQYLRHQAILLPSEAPKGYVVVTFKNIPLGFVKNLGNRANNLYPSEWRIRNL